MFLISTFSWAIAFCTSAACSGVSWRNGWNLGCFFAYAQPTPRVRIRRARGNFRNIMCNSWFNTSLGTSWLSRLPRAPCSASRLRTGLRTGYLDPALLMLRQLEGDGDGCGEVYRPAVTRCRTEMNLLRHATRLFIKSMAQPVHYALHHDLA